MEEVEKAKEVNRDLIRDFGYFEETNLANFRVIYVVSSLTEVRSGVHAEFHGEIFIRETIGTKEDSKYSYIDHVYALERQFGTNGPEVARGDGYEPLYFFYNYKEELRLPLRYDVCRLIALASLVAKPMKTKKMIENEENAARQRVFDKRMDILSQELTWLGHLFKHREAIIQPGTQGGASPNLRRKE